MSDARRGRFRSRQGGFTLLEIMIALAVLAVGAVCVLSTFAAAIALHMRREDDVRMARVIDEARTEAQALWNGWRSDRDHPLPPPLKEQPWSRDSSFLYSISFQLIEGQPRGLDGSANGAAALIQVSREGRADRPPKEMLVFLARTEFKDAEMKRSLTWEQEKKADEMRKNDPSRKQVR